MLDNFAIGWEQGLLDQLDRLKQRRESGLATESEAWDLTKLEHITVIHELMMSGALEEKGFWTDQESNAETDSLNQLTDRVWRFCSSGKEQVQKTLAYAFRKGNLIRRQGDGHIRWSWRDFLERGDG
jgi:hypothetical protein